MGISFEKVYDTIRKVRIRAYEDELERDETLDLLEKELIDIEYDD